MSRFMIASLGLFALGLGACSTSETDSSSEPTLEEALADKRIGERTDRLCFTRGVNGFSEWDGPDGLILNKGARDKYLVLVQRSCRTIDNAQRVGVDSRFGSGCVSRGDYLFISEEIFGGRSSTDPFTSDRCLITAIYQWNEDAGDDNDGE
ncbi:MAG: DUF6491 family protein [Pseudomonadota bacterium]